MTRIVLINHEPIVRVGLRALLEKHEDLDVVAEAPDAASAAGLLERSAIDVVVCEIHQVDARNLAALQRLTGRSPAVAVLLLAANADTATALRVILAGAWAFLPSHASGDTVVQTVRAIAADTVVLPGQARKDLSRHVKVFSSRSSARLQELSDRERQVLGLLAEGRSNEEIARALYLSKATVKKHVSQLLHKLGLRDRLQAGLYGSELGLGQLTTTSGRRK